MKALVFIYLFLFFFSHCFGQRNTTSNKQPEIKTKTITLGLSAGKSPTKTPIKKLIVIDARADTTTLGFQTLDNNRCYSYTPADLTDEVTTFLNDYLRIEKSASPDDKTIVISIKKLWLSDKLQIDADPKDFDPQRSGGVIAKLEFYCSNGIGYTPMYRFDTVYRGMKNMRFEAREFIDSILIMSVQQLIAIGTNYPSPAEKQMTLAEIGTYNQRQLNPPVITASVYKKGVYKTFDEFKSNDPSIISYNIVSEKLTKTIFFKDDHEEYPIRDVWGYSDGSHVYIKCGDNYFELIKRQNTFISFAARSLVFIRSLKLGNVLMLGAAFGTIGPHNKKITYELILRLYELDFDTGELY